MGFFVFFAVAGVVVSAQTTWKELRFGMTAVEVRKQYQGTLQEKKTEQGTIMLENVHQKLADENATADL